MEKENLKITIVMPTYNDEKTIKYSLDSIINQTYTNWQLIISNDGSTDNTDELVIKYIKEKNIEDKVKYIKDKNGDQNNAILRALDFIEGDYVYILHSDDLLNGNDLLQKAINLLNKNKKYDAIIADAILINENREKTGYQKTKKYKNKEYIMPLMQLWLGRNLYIDMAFFKKEIFKTKVKNSYLMWNFPFWYDPKANEMLKVTNSNFPFFKYMVSESNYINNEIGALNVINGELRTAINLMKTYDIPLYKFQYLVFRTFNKLGLNYKPIYFKKETKDGKKYDLIKFIMNKKYKDEEIDKYICLKNPLLFFKNLKYNKRSINLPKISKDDFIYYGKDVRRYSKDVLNNNISKPYKYILDEMEKGFREVIVEDKEDYDKAKVILKFLYIDKFVNLKIK